MNASYVSANDLERVRLFGLLGRLTDEDLARRLPSGLAVAAVLIHLAFWDQYASSVLQEWKASGFSSSRTHFEALNSAILFLASSIPDRAAVDMARSAASDVDREAEGVSPELAQVIVENGKLRTLERAQHRRDHVDQIEELLARA